MNLLFYTTAGCHLCEQAQTLLDVLKTQHLVEIIAVDISSSEELVDLYGIRIPVVKNEATGEELGWPFGYDELLSLI
jgi:GT2 family glycosyltransferase